MASKKLTKEQKYEGLLKAMSEGDFGKAKYFWNIIEELHATDEKMDEKLEDFQARIDKFIKAYTAKDGKDGKPGARGLRGPAGKDGIGKDGKPGRDGKDGKDGIDGFDGKDGKPGEAPDHQWDGTKIRFKSGKEWGEWVDLKGPMGPTGLSFGPGEGGMGGGLERVRSGSTVVREGVSEITFGDNLTVTRTANGVRVDGENGGGSGGGIDFETPTGTVDDSNLSFTVVNTPIYIVVNGAQYFESVHYSLAGLTITLFDAIGTGGFIRSAFGTGVTVENPTGTIDDSNVTFTVSNTPKYVVVNGAQYFDGAGYSYTGGTITLDNAVGTGGFIRSVY